MRLPWISGILLSVALLVPSGRAAIAADPPLPQPKGQVILTVSGKIGRGNGTDARNAPVARFDREMLETLDQRAIATETPWHEGIQRFEGPRAAALIAAVQASGETARAIALNEYVTELPIGDWRDDQFILALNRNGQPMSVRDKGPLFVIYNYAGVPKEKQGALYNRSIWQLSRIEFR